MKNARKPKAIIAKTLSLLAKNRQKYLPVDVLITVFIMLFTFSCGKVEKTVEEETVAIEENIVPKAPDEGEDIPYESETKFKMHMKSLDEFDEVLADSIDRQDWTEIIKNAMKLKNTSPVAFTGKRKEDLPQDFVMLDTMFHLQALAVVEASQSREMVRLNIEYEKLQQTCDDCHVKYKKKES